MSLLLTAGPAAEPVSLAEAKAHVRIDGAAEDGLLASLITTSRLHIEAALGLALITQSWQLQLDAWPKRGGVVLPLRPVQAIDAVRVTAFDGTVVTLEPSHYRCDGYGLPPRLLPAASPFPDPGANALGIEIAFVAGYGAAAADVPAPIRQALLHLVAHWFEHREPVHVGATASRIPDMVSELLEPYRLVRL